eukprot:TRINITY_DN2910_c0_g2_i1.p1 TRINITY_DN2910_c0_g2~~TRINITY_DN2910_c0_g2_i1.p1  ORF type:complete len:347 (-),score=37.84 TRINITY_DN2910_c0_g2_i1:36-932(-)
MADAYESNGFIHNYFILMILTDGLIMDFKQTEHEIVRASSLPLSIVIVGIGNEDFSEMDQLDADEAPLYSQKLGKYMERDIVQFVPFSKFANNPNELAKETLAEIPKQLIDYMSQKGIQPTNEKKESNFDYFEMRKQEMKEILCAQNIDPSRVDEMIEKGLHTLNLNHVLPIIQQCFPNPLLTQKPVEGGIVSKSLIRKSSGGNSGSFIGEDANPFQTFDSESSPKRKKRQWFEKPPQQTAPIYQNSVFSQSTYPNQGQHFQQPPPPPQGHYQQSAYQTYPNQPMPQGYPQQRPLDYQ